MSSVTSRLMNGLMNGLMNDMAPQGGISFNRISAMILRYWYLLLSSWPRLLELMYWPILQVITWGFLQSYIAQNANFFARAGGTLIGAVILWDILFRGQLGFSISFLEEMWARNLGNLMMSPLKPIEFLIALMAMSVIRLAIGVIPMTVLALFLFHFNVFALGLPLIAFFCNLIFTSWAVGIFVSGLVLRHGLGAESIVWTLMFALMPLACVYYPVHVLPLWLQYVSWSLPPTYVFEGMRALLIDHVFRADLMLSALVINAVLLLASFAAFLALLRSARRHGSLLGGGE
jgi:ABC-2 type transport system permease protein